MKAFNQLFLTLSLLLLVSAATIAQKSQFSFSDKKYKNKYVDQLEDGESIKKSWINYVATKTKDKKYFVRVYYNGTKQLAVHEQYKGKKYKIRHGSSKAWFENGIKISEGSYKNNKKVGQWKFYNENDGLLYSTGTFKDNYKSGLWVELENGDTMAVYTYKYDMKDGPFIEYDSIGNIIDQGRYLPDEMPMLKSDRCDKIVDYHERKKCAEEAMLRFIYSNLQYPVSARSNRIQGRAIVEFLVTKNGDIKNITVIEGILKDINEECIKAIKRLPKFNPGLRNKAPVDMPYILPILFKLAG